MTQYDDKNRFSIWPNRKKREGKKDPDFTGSINVDGHDYWIDAWKKSTDAKENAPSLSGTVKRKDSRPQSAGAAPKATSRTSNDDMDGDAIPF